VCNSSKIVRRLGKSASCKTTSRSLEIVYTTTLLATRTLYTTVNISYNNVQTEEVKSKREGRYREKKREVGLELLI
jgi:hypothetical protein